MSKWNWLAPVITVLSLAIIATTWYMILINTCDCISNIKNPLSCKEDSGRPEPGVRTNHFIRKGANRNFNIIQTWKTEQIPRKYKKFFNSVRSMNPHANFMFFTDKEIENFVMENFPQYSKLFNNFDFKIQKIDFFRYLAVYLHGGVYLDLDMYMTMPFDYPFFENDCVFPIEYLKNGDKILQNKGFKRIIGNYGFYATPRHPFLKFIVDQIEENLKTFKYLKKTRKDKFILYTTGPVAVTNAYIDFKDKESVKLLQEKDFKKDTFGKYGNHMMVGSWR